MWVQEKVSDPARWGLHWQEACRVIKYQGTMPTIKGPIWTSDYETAVYLARLLTMGYLSLEVFETIGEIKTQLENIEEGEKII